jgi:hypothetical protein
MSNDKRLILLAGAIIVAALWFRVLAVSVFATSETVETSDNAVVVDSAMTYLEDVQAALPETDEFSKICTSGNGLPVSCSDISDDTMCISLRVGAHSGTRIDCNTHQAIPADDYGGPGAGGAKYRSPY